MSGESSSCPYRHVFGRPGEGVHAHRIFGVASVDLALTVLGAALIARLRAARRRPPQRTSATSTIYWFVVLMIVALALHLAAGVDTTLTVMVRGRRAECGDL